MVDDLLDETQSTQHLGKTGKDWTRKADLPRGPWHRGETTIESLEQAAEY